MRKIAKPQKPQNSKIFGGKNFDFFGFCNGHFFSGGGVPGKKIFVVAENDIDKKLLTKLLDRSGSCDKNLFFLFFVEISIYTIWRKGLQMCESYGSLMVILLGGFGQKIYILSDERTGKSVKVMTL